MDIYFNSVQYQDQKEITARAESRFFSILRDKSLFLQIYETNCAFFFKSEEQICAFSFQSEGQISRSL